MATDGATTVTEILNSEEQSELQPTPLPILIVSQQDPVTPEKTTIYSPEDINPRHVSL